MKMHDPQATLRQIQDGARGLEDLIRPYAGPLFFASSLESASVSVVNNGSYALVDTGRRKVLVTCQHVWGEFQKSHGANPELRMMLCLDQNPAVVFDPQQPIDQDDGLDIATFEMDPLLGACGGRKFYALNQCPAPKVVVGGSLVFVGYPGFARSATAEGLEFGRMCFMMTVSDADASGLTFVADSSKTRQFDRDDKPVAARGASVFGGISGSPCFLVQGKDVRLVGFATTAVLGIFRFAHACCLNTDGTIKRRDRTSRQSQ